MTALFPMFSYKTIGVRHDMAAHRRQCHGRPLAHALCTFAIDIFQESAPSPCNFIKPPNGALMADTIKARYSDTCYFDLRDFRPFLMVPSKIYGAQWRKTCSLFGCSRPPNCTIVPQLAGAWATQALPDPCYHRNSQHQQNKKKLFGEGLEQDALALLLLVCSRWFLFAAERMTEHPCC